MNKKQADAVVKQHYFDIYKFCRAKCRSNVYAEDITHNTFVIFYEKAESLDNKNIRAWLYKTASNLVNEYFREKKKEQTYVSIYDTDLPLFEPDIENFGEAKDDFNSFQQNLLSLLNEDEKQLFIQLFIRRKAIQEFADQSKVSVDTVYQRKSRLKKKLKKGLSNADFMFIFVLFLVFRKF